MLKMSEKLAPDIIKQPLFFYHIFPFDIGKWVGTR